MIKFVVPRPVKKKQRTYIPLDEDKKRIRSWFHFFSIKVIRIIFGIFAVVYWGYYLLKSTILNHQYLIKRVLYDSGDIARYDEPYLYKRINTKFKGENFYVARFYRDRVLADIQTVYPMVSAIDISYRSSNTVVIKLTFRPIDLVIRNQAERYAIIRDQILRIYSGNKLADGIKILDLPPYLSGMHAMSGFFFRQLATGLVEQTELLYQWFPWLTGLEYLPWGERSIVYLEGKRFFINNLGDIPNQIRNYQLLKKYYKEYAKLQDVDLGSLGKDKVIVRRF